MEPPIHTEYLRSGGAMILIFMVLGAKAVISFCIRSAIPGYIVEPPERTVFAYKSLRISISHFMMLLYDVSWIPADSIPMKEGLRKYFDQRHGDGAEQENLYNNNLSRCTNYSPGTGLQDNGIVRCQQ